jgi:hypothetical protein
MSEVQAVVSGTSDNVRRYQALSADLPFFDAEPSLTDLLVESLLRDVLVGA